MRLKAEEKKLTTKLNNKAISLSSPSPRLAEMQKQGLMQ
jgi:hypothetical protein